MRKLMVILGLVCLAASFASAGQINKTLYFDQPEINRLGDFDRVILPGCLTISNPGEPMMPRQAISMLLPAGEEAVRIEYVFGDKLMLDGSYHIQSADRQYPIGFAGPFEQTAPLAEIYNSNNKYPSQMEQGLSTQFFRGHGVAFLNICPMEYYPQSGNLYYYKQIEVRIITEPTARANDSYRMFLRDDSNTNNRLADYIQNVESISSFYGQSSLEVDDDGNYDYLIITVESLESSFEVLAEYKNRTGFLTEIMLVSDIVSDYTGVDNQEKIRNCIIDQYQNHGIEYVLLAGDDELLPHRGFYDDAGGSVNENDVPADIYFSNLDGTWNDDGDNRWGEPEEADLVGEVFIGRMAVDSPTEAANFINKTIMYQYQPVVEDIDNTLMLGEDLGWDVWGSDYKEEIRLGSDSWGYTTVGLPRYGFQQDTLYDRNGSWSPMTDLIPALNNGMNLVNHLGHADVEYIMKFYNSSVNDNTFTNDGVDHGFYLMYSQGCYCGAFDNRGSGGNYGNDCITEVLTTIEHGPVVMITNSRYGWGSVSNTDGSSQYYDRQFFDAIFGENITRVGEIQSDSKLDNIPFIDYAQNRWCFYCSNLFGDPTLDLWLDQPETMVASHDDEIMLGMENFAVSLSDDDSDPIAGARVALSHDGVCVGRGITDEYGMATINLIGIMQEPINLDLTAVAHNFAMYEAIIEVLPPDGPFLTYNTCEIDDEVGGNNDGILDYNETVEIWLTLQNVGSETAENVYAEIATDNQYILVVDNTASFGDLAAGESGMGQDSYTIWVSPNCPDMHRINFEIEVHAENSPETWTQPLLLFNHAPLTSFAACDIDDHISGDGDGELDPGESVNLYPCILNSGSSELGDFYGHLFTNDPYVTITDGEAPGGPITPGTQAALNSAIAMSVSEDCPVPYEVTFTLSVNALNGYFSSMTFSLIVCGMFEDFEDGENGFTHSVVLDGFYDQWHMSAQRNHTEAGEHSWKCGDEGSGDYLNLLDAGLTMPPFEVGNYSLLKFWQWLDAEESSTYPGYAYDGGLLEITIDDGVNWNQIEPLSGYPYLIRTGGDPGPFSSETGVFSGLNDWREITFDLSEFANETAKLRFRFGSDGYQSREGWFIDDIRIAADNLQPVPMDLNVVMSSESQVILNWSAPVDNTPDGYNIYHCDESGDYEDTPINPILVTEITFIDETCELTRDNYYVVTAFYAGDTESNYSNEAYLPARPVDISDDENALPLTYQLSQNYPNPFNPLTTIQFNLPETSPVNLEIYDILGRKVETLIDQSLPAGYHSVVWNASPYATGIYFYKLTARDFMQSRKMIMLK